MNFPFTLHPFPGDLDAIIAVAVVLAIFAGDYVAMSRHIANVGAFYAYISQGLSRPLGVGASWVALVAYNVFQ